MSVVIETTVGDITVDLFLIERPRACQNFLKLCKIKYYHYNLFHTVSRGFIAQTGDPTGCRSGGESIYGVLDGTEKRFFEGESEPRIKHTKMGLISFVGNEERMIGSQFFITLGDDLSYLDEKHCVFGEVVEGFDILEIINEAICDTDDRPYQDIRITHTVILEDPFPDPAKLHSPSRSPSPSIERLQGGRIAPDEEIDEMEGKSNKEIAEMQAEREAKARATILEMVGDLPDADMAPPENVLFVCKLNPLTSDEDLEIIFNRFGKIKSCEVIRDRKTGDSLQYAFIEFEEEKSCEDAYFKMDNILIDDRRIHVDFSQSVSKIKWHGKGKGVTHYDEKGRKKTDSNNDIGKGTYKPVHHSGKPIPYKKPQGSVSPSLSPERSVKLMKNRKSPLVNRRSRTPSEKYSSNARHKNYDHRERPDLSPRVKQYESRISSGRGDTSGSPRRTTVSRESSKVIFKSKYNSPKRDEYRHSHQKKERSRSPRKNRSDSRNISKNYRDHISEYSSSKRRELKSSSQKDNSHHNNHPEYYKRNRSRSPDNRRRERKKIVSETTRTPSQARHDNGINDKKTNEAPKERTKKPLKKKKTDSESETNSSTDEEPAKKKKKNFPSESSMSRKVEQKKKNNKKTRPNNSSSDTSVDTPKRNRRIVRKRNKNESSTTDDSDEKQKERMQKSKNSKREITSSSSSSTSSSSSSSSSSTSCSDSDENTEIRKKQKKKSQFAKKS